MTLFAGGYKAVHLGSWQLAKANQSDWRFVIMKNVYFCTQYAWEDLWTGCAQWSFAFSLRNSHSDCINMVYIHVSISTAVVGWSRGYESRPNQVVPNFATFFFTKGCTISFFPCKYNACSEWPWNLIKMNLYDYILYSRCSEVINIV